ncbi:MAG TPA: sulfite exporter TauE/SafE family protein [Kiritimatiellia bacterium]|nr:sulfite exporter TauE/SafE family protein [Kiritimatiellia bacterium]
MMHNVMFVLLGILAGVLSGLFGLGGGFILIPALVILFGFSQHMAQGTTLALMVPPIGIFAAWMYWKNGHVHLPAAALICVGFIAGSILGARFVEGIPDAVLRRVFGGVFLVLSLRMIFFK